MAATAQKSQKTEAGAQQPAKGGLDQVTPAADAKIARSWLKYVKDLPGADKAQSQPPGAGTQSSGPKVGDDKPKLREEPKPNTVHDGKTHEAKYGDFGKQVFDKGAQLEDVQQGYLADCYLVAAMGAVAMQRPELIEKMIKDNGDGTVTVTLYVQNNSWLAPPGEGKAVDVRISMKLPTANGTRPTYARSSSKELWPALIEKAYVAQFGGGDYQKVNAGGSPGDAMAAMTGQQSTGFSTGSKKAADIVTELSDMLKAGKPVVAASFGKDEAKTNDKLKKLADDKAVHAWHAYVIKKADPKADTIELFNPWGSDHPQTLSGEDFKTLYRHVYVGAPKKPGT